VARNLGQAIDFANEYAPEHLEIITENPEKVLPMIENAGSIFIGPYSPVAAGDFITGPNHILPTGGKARCRSGLSALDFTRLPTVQMLSKAALLELMKDIEALAAAEGLPAHVKSVGVRVGEKYGN
jgi:histidinol dehydrogenase